MFMPFLYQLFPLCYDVQNGYQSMLLDMMAACAYMNTETLFFECFRECFFHTFSIYDNLRYIDSMLCDAEFL